MKKFPFDFDEEICVYHLKEEDLDAIELVLANGDTFTVFECTQLKRRDKKAAKKFKDYQELQGGIDVTNFVK